jgi:hypothetical protein
MPNGTARREQQRRFAEAREAERGDYDADRGDYDADRGDYDADRGDYDADRGDYDADRGGGLDIGRSGAQASRVATDIFRRAASIGGHLIVAFVAPVGATPAPRRRLRTRASSSEAQAAAAGVQVAALMEQLRQSHKKARQNPTVPTPSNDAQGSAQTSTSKATQQPAQTISGSGRRSAD